jgi:phytoene dehydrogenase-like protein
LGLLNHYLDGAYFPIGGSKAIRDAYVKGIETKGGTALRNHAGSRILLENGRVSGVHCKNGEEYFAPTIISNVDAVTTYRDLIGTANLSSSLRKKTSDTRHSLASLCLFIGTDLDITQCGMTDANIWNYASIDIDRAYAPILRGELPPHEFFFLSSPSLKDPISGAKAPPGHHTLEFVTLAPFEPFAPWAEMKTKKRGQEYEQLKTKLEARYLESIEKYVPGIGKHVTTLDLGTPATNVSYTSSPLGSIYGPEMTPAQMTPFRYGARGAIDGLYLCGSSVLGAGIVPCAASGSIAAKTALRDQKSRR